MRKLLTTLLLSSLLFACRKMNDPDAVPGRDLSRETHEVNVWLEKQKETANETGLERIKALQQNLDFASLVSPAFGDDEMVYIVPVKAAFGSKNNAERNPQCHLVLFISKETHKVRKGNIVQFISKTPFGKARLQQFMFDYYAFGKKEFTGSLAYLTVADEMLYEISYLDGELNYYKSVGKKPETGRNATCYEIGWYYFWSDGSVTWEPIGQYCDGCEPVKTVQGKTYRVGCGSGGDQGGADESPTKLMTWLVYRENMYGPPIEIYAQVQFWGKKASDYPQGGYFYRSVDQGTYTSNFSTYNINLANVYTQAWHGPQHGYQSFQGVINYNSYGSVNREVTKTRTFEFVEVFP